MDPDGTVGLGRGAQEQFYGCSDVKIVPMCQAWDTSCRNQLGQVSPDQVWFIYSLILFLNSLHNICIRLLPNGDSFFLLCKDIKSLGVAEKTNTTIFQEHH